MATKAQQNEDGTVSDPVTTETQKGYANYEADLAKKQKERKEKEPYEALLKLGTDLMGRPIKKAKGGVIKSASKRADGIAIRGKTRA
jgi:hypothetical protein